MPDTLQIEDRFFQVADFLGGVNSYFPQDKIPDNALVSAQNAIVEENGVITRRHGLTTQGDFNLGQNVTGSGIVGGTVAGEGAFRRVFLAVNYNPSPLSAATVIFTWDGSNWTAHTSVNDINATTEEQTNAAFVRESSGTDYLYWVSPLFDTVRTDFQTPSTQVNMTVIDGTVNSNPPLNVRYITSALGRVWIAGKRGNGSDKLYWSANSKAGLEIWDQTINVAQIMNDTGQAITALFPYRENMLGIGLESSIVLEVIGTSNLLTSFESIVSRDIGVGSNRTVENVGEDVYFMDQRGEIRSLQQVLAQKSTTAKTQALSVPIRDAIKTIDLDDLFRSAAGYHNELYWLSFSTSTGWKSYSFSPVTRTWSGAHVFKNNAGTELEVRLFLRTQAALGTDTSNQRRDDMYIATYDGTDSATTFNLYLYDPTTVTDDGTAVDFEIITKAYDFGFPHQEKYLKWVDIETEVVSGLSGSLEVQGRADFDDWVMLEDALDYTEGDVLKRHRVLIGRKLGRAIRHQLKISCSDTNTSPRITRLIFNYQVYEAPA